MLLLFIFSQALSNFEEDIYTAISEDLQVKPVNYVMQGIDFVSYPAFDVVSPTVFYICNKRDVAKHGFIGFIGNCLTVFPLKYAINRQRPIEEHGRWNSSFPSGHTSFCFTQVVVYSHHYPKYTLPLYLYATIVGFSRIYLEKHYPTDVLGGAALGISVGVLTLKIFK